MAGFLALGETDPRWRRAAWAAAGLSFAAMALTGTRAAQGLPGLACLAAFCLIGLRGDRWTRAALAAALAAQQFTAFTVPTALLFYVTMALTVERRDGGAALWQRAPLVSAPEAAAAADLDGGKHPEVAAALQH
jgi:hypothetical protein